MNHGFIRTADYLSRFSVLIGILLIYGTEIYGTENLRKAL